MKQLTLTFPHMVRTISIDDATKADVAYAAVKLAMDEHREFGNDKNRTIEVDYGIGSETVLVGALAGVGLADMDSAEETLIKKAIWERRMEAKIAAALAPAAE
jgi:hypothetical protein